MRRRAACSTIALLLAPAVGAAQQPYVQLGAGAGLGAHTTDGVPADRGPFPTGALAFGLAWPAVFVRADARAFDTEYEPLVTLGLAVGTPLLRSERARLYVMGGAGAGYFMEEFDPGHHLGVGIGLTTTRLAGLYAELRYDRLVGTFTYDSRRRNLASLVAGVRVGPRRSRRAVLARAHRARHTGVPEAGDADAPASRQTPNPSNGHPCPRRPTGGPMVRSTRPTSAAGAGWWRRSSCGGSRYRRDGAGWISAAARAR